VPALVVRRSPSPPVASQNAICSCERTTISFCSLVARQPLLPFHQMPSTASKATPASLVHLKS